MDSEFPWGKGGLSRRIVEIPGGGGTAVKPPETESPGGGGVKLEKTPVRGYGYFLESNFGEQV